MDWLYDLIYFVGFLSAPVLIFLIFLKRRRRRSEQSLQPDGPAQETAADLTRAEEDLQKLPIDIRETLIETHDLYDRFSTHRGYSNVYMETFTARIRAAGIDCEAVFQQTLPMGLADAVVEPQGLYELYIRRENMNEARKRIPLLLETQKDS